MTKVLFATAALFLSFSSIASAAVDPAGVANPVFSKHQALTDRHAVAWLVTEPANATRADDQKLSSDHNNDARAE